MKKVLLFVVVTALTHHVSYAQDAQQAEQIAPQVIKNVAALVEKNEEATIKDSVKNNLEKEVVTVVKDTVVDKNTASESIKTKDISTEATDAQDAPVIVVAQAQEETLEASVNTADDKKNTSGITATGEVIIKDEAQISQVKKQAVQKSPEEVEKEFEAFMKELGKMFEELEKKSQQDNDVQEDDQKKS